MHVLERLALLIILFLAAVSTCDAQLGRTSNVRAVVVGISDYESEDIPDLRFAHKDAAAFRDFLRSPAGGEIPEENVRFLVNEDATGGNIHKALFWLIKETQPGDECIIYFSGHGDVETIFEDEPGHLLLYDTPASIYQINSLRLDDLRRIINTLSVQTDAKITIFSDACRSGKLAGSKVNGSQATAAAFGEQFANEVKVLSCQPNEFSIEGEEWGGGRGLFSYHLVNGLIGLADDDEDEQVDVRELIRYLEDQFDASLSGEKQTPVAIGDKNRRMSFVDPESLEALRLEVDETKPEEPVVVFEGEESAGDYWRTAFYAALGMKYYLDSDSLGTNFSAEHSADYCFKQLTQDASLSAVIPIIKGDFIAALQDDAQAAINRYLLQDESEMKTRWMGDLTQFRNYPLYLAKALELIGRNHYIYPQLEAKQMYFSVVYDRIRLERGLAAERNYEELEAELLKALIIEARSPFINNEYGWLLYLMGRYDEAMSQFDRAIEISPRWALPYNNKSVIYNALKEYDSAIEYALQAEEIKGKNRASDLNLGLAYKSLAFDFETQGSYDSAIYFMRKASSRLPDKHGPTVDIGHLMTLQGNHSAALEYLKSLESKNISTPELYRNLGVLSLHLQDTTEALMYYEKTIEMDSLSIVHYYMAWILMEKNRISRAIELLQLYVDRIMPGDQWGLFDLACCYAYQNELKKFESHMELAIENGFKSQNEYLNSKYLRGIQDTPQYARILKILKKQD